MTKIGDVLTSTNDENPDLHVVGGHPASGRWIVREGDEFDSGPRLLSDEEADAYGVTDAPTRSSEQEGWNRLRDAHEDARMEGGRRILRDQPLTPQQALEEGAGSPVTFQVDGKVYEAGTEEAAEVEGQPQRWGRIHRTDNAPWLE